MITISFIVPVYNSGRYLRSAVDSILANQVVSTEIEILLIDDCSTDSETIIILEELSCIKGVRLIKQYLNKGPAYARNTGIRESKGEWVAFLDSDDLLMPRALEKRLEILERYPDAKWIASDFCYLMDNSNLAPNEKSGDYQIDPALSKIVDKGVSLYERPTEILLQLGGTLQVGTTMLRKDTACSVGLFKDDLIYGEDWYFWLLVSRVSDLYMLESPTCMYRKRAGSLMSQHLKLADNVPSVAIHAFHDPRLAMVRQQLRWNVASRYRWSSRLYRENGRPFKAFVSAIRSLLWSPNDVRGLKEAIRAIGSMIS